MPVQFDITLTLIVACGLILFTYFLYIGRHQKKKIAKRRERLKNNWKDRLE
ncbi:hypothetical protein K1X84_11305 [bacterium]|nr:hypothetical protein [bacterium]